ncbi:hypothetical protein QBC46DRAFT_391038 [Diplogelasinospora grovesii]|uniref:Secreted protein n=1 Tax=Diplogelasinospora grovesii TaxID=303347 RepID=A0AAN6N629_9PEZI|nr:hypothetical protein QBC46DRAFT_391038 [Diplogelasinospora grovesii]
MFSFSCFFLSLLPSNGQSPSVLRWSPSFARGDSTKPDRKNKERTRSCAVGQGYPASHRECQALWRREGGAFFGAAAADETLDGGDQHANRSREKQTTAPRRPLGPLCVCGSDDPSKAPPPAPFKARGKRKAGP